MVYVDGLMEWPLGSVHGAERVNYWCHMFADSLEELHDMALKIGMKRLWFQISKSGIPHYDLSKSRRKMAVSLGAIEFTATLADLQRFKALIE